MQEGSLSEGISFHSPRTCPFQEGHSHLNCLSRNPLNCAVETCAIAGTHYTISTIYTILYLSDIAMAHYLAGASCQGSEYESPEGVAQRAHSLARSCATRFQPSPWPRQSHKTLPTMAGVERVCRRFNSNAIALSIVRSSLAFAPETAKRPASSFDRLRMSGQGETRESRRGPAILRIGQRSVRTQKGTACRFTSMFSWRARI
jgi:hypothetical protein